MLIRKLLPKNVAPNKKVGSRPLARATCLEAPQYNFYAAKTQEKPKKPIASILLVSPNLLEAIPSE
jgi:hypothetical protein